MTDSDLHIDAVLRILDSCQHGPVAKLYTWTDGTFMLAAMLNSDKDPAQTVQITTGPKRHVEQTASQWRADLAEMRKPFAQEHITEDVAI